METLPPVRPLSSLLSLESRLMVEAIRHGMDPTEAAAASVSELVWYLTTNELK